MNLFKSLFIISSVTVLSRILGFIRDAIIARVFGVDMFTDSFFVAFKFSNLLRRIFAEGAFSQAFVPVLVEYKNKRDMQVTHIFVSCITGLLIFVLVLFIMICFVIAPELILVTAPGFVQYNDKFILSVLLLRITLPYLFLISLSSLIGAILNAWNRIFVPAFTPVLLNISMIIFTLAATTWFNPPILSLAWSVIMGGILQLLFQIPFLKRIDMLVIPRLCLYNVGVWKVLRLMGISIFAASSSQISLILNTIFASFLVSGSISWLYYADRLIEFPIGILGVSLSTILLPRLSKLFTEKKFSEYSYLIDWGLKICFVFSLPSALLLCFLSRPLITVLFQYGNFSLYDVQMTQHAVIAYSIGLVGLILVKILASAFYSFQDTKIPVFIAVITIILTQLMNLIFIGPLKHIALTLSISLGSYFNAGMLFWKLRDKQMFIPRPGWLIFFLRLLLAVVVMLLTLFVLGRIDICSVNATILPNSIIQLIRDIIVCIVVYFFVLWWLGIRFKDFAYLP